LMLIQRALPAGKQHGQGRNTEAIGSFLKAWWKILRGPSFESNFVLILCWFCVDFVSFEYSILFIYLTGVLMLILTVVIYIILPFITHSYLSEHLVNLTLSCHNSSQHMTLDDYGWALPYTVCHAQFLDTLLCWALPYSSDCVSSVHSSWRPKFWQPSCRIKLWAIWFPNSWKANWLEKANVLVSAGQTSTKLCRTP
jgi:hypothetical protein